MTRSKIASDLVVNYIALATLGVSGLIINFLVGRFLGAEVLGMFNQVLTIYIIVSQFSVLGIQFSLLKYLSQYRAENRPFDELVTGAMLGAFICSLVVFIVLINFHRNISSWFDSDGVAANFLFVVPAVFLFGLNKVQISILNGLREMAVFGFFQAQRMVLILIGIAATIVLEADVKWLIISITIAESIQFLSLFAVTIRHYNFRISQRTFEWVRAHFSFGMKGVMNGGVSELNSRIDVIVVGVFLSDTAVGIYSMASTVIEGIMQIPAIVRNVINPVLSEYWFSGSREKLFKFIKVLVIRFYLAFFIAAIFALIAFYIMVHYVVGSVFEPSIPIFAILLVGLIVSAGFLPLEMLPIQLGFPILQSSYKTIVALVNIGLNIILIQYFGLLGVAVATSISFVVSVILLVLLTNWITATGQNRNKHKGI